MATWPEGTSMSIDDAERIKRLGHPRPQQASIVVHAIRDAFYEGYRTNGPYYQDEVDTEWEAYAKMKGLTP